VPGSILICVFSDVQSGYEMSVHTLSILSEPNLPGLRCQSTKCR
jgi:hypothetical protein